MDTLTQDQADQTQNTHEDQVSDQTQDQQDPFSIDEAQLAALTPEARVAFDSTVKNWRSKADEYAKSMTKAEVEKATARYKDYDEKAKFAEALQQLTADPRFAQWYQMTYQQPQQQQVPQVASAEEWAQAQQEAMAGQPQRLQMIIARQFQMMAAPTIKQFQDHQQSFQQDRELDGLFRRHPDAEELDDTEIWGEGKTPLELAIHQIVDKEGKSFEEAYQVARSMVDAADRRAKNAALGMVNRKKDGITEPTSKTSRETDTVIEVASAEEALRKNVEATMKGQKITYVSKPRVLRR